MARIEVDREKLEYGLETGIMRSDTVYSSFDRDSVLRYAPCGLVSSAIFEYLEDQVIETKQYISTPRLSFDHQMQHVIPMIEVDGNPMVLDAAYSQFIRYAGGSRSYGAIEKDGVYPEEKIAVFRFSALDLFVNWMAEATLRYQKLGSELKGIPLVDKGRGPLHEASADEIKDTITRIYDPKNLSPHTPKKRVQNDGRYVARFIPYDAVQIILDT